jgi:hypothetical protein
VLNVVSKLLDVKEKPEAFAEAIMNETSPKLRTQG